MIAAAFRSKISRNKNDFPMNHKKLPLPNSQYSIQTKKQLMLYFKTES